MSYLPQVTIHANNEDLAAALLAKHRDFPLAAFQEALTSNEAESLEVAMCVALHPTCGVNLRADIAEANTRARIRDAMELKPTPLSLAIRAGRFDVMRELLEAGADAKELYYDVCFKRENDRRGYRGPTYDFVWSPLFMAVGNGASGADIDLLISKGANPNTGFGALTPLHAAAKTNNLAALEALARTKGINLNITGERISETMHPSGWTPVRLAVKFKHIDAVKILIEHGASVESTDNRCGLSPLLAAVHNRDIATAIYFVEHGANAKAREWQNGRRKDCLIGDYGSNFLYIAADKNLSELIPCLLEKGADSYLAGTYRCKYFFCTTLHYAAEQGNAKVINALLSHGVGVSESECRSGNIPPQVSKSNIGNTPLHYAAMYSPIEAIQALLDHGADLDATNKEGLTAIEAAVRSDNGAAIALLAAEGGKYSSHDFYDILY